MGVREVKAYLKEKGGGEGEEDVRVSPPSSVSLKTAGVYCRHLFRLLRGRTGEWVWLRRSVDHLEDNFEQLFFENKLCEVTLKVNQVLLGTC